MSIGISLQSYYLNRMHRNRFQPHLWSLLLTGWLVVCCTAPEDKKPEGLFAKERMVDILTEVHLAEARVTKLNLGDLDSSKIAYKHLESKILQKFKVDTAAYRSSYIFYASHPRDMEAIYLQVTKNLEKKLSPKSLKHA